MPLVKIAIMIGAISYYSSGEDVYIGPEVALEVVQSGLASWYGSMDGTNDNGLHGQITATGELFTGAGRTCASRTIPLNTIVLIELKRNGSKIWCRVNDRGPYGAMHKGKWVLKLSRGDPGKWRGVIDMSRGAAEAIGFDFEKGLESISIRYHKKKIRRRSVKRFAMVFIE